jgi:hypothetical protein
MARTLIGNVHDATRRSLEILTEAETIPVAVLYIKVTAAIGLVTNITGDLHVLRFELSIQSVDIVNPDIRIQGLSVRIGQVVRAHGAASFQLAELDNDATAIDHTERWRISPEALVIEPELVAIIIRCRDDVIDNETWRNVPI